MTKVIPGELASVTGLLAAFLQDLPPDPDSLDDIEVDQKVLDALLILAKSLTPKNTDEEMELAYIFCVLENTK